MPEVDPAVAAPAAPAVAAAPAPALAAAALLTDPAAAPAVAAAPAAAPAAPAAVTMPGKDATPEDWAKFYDTIGAPKDAEGYELPIPDGVDPAFAKTAAGWMAEARLTPDQAKSVAGKWNAFVAEQKATAQAQASAKETERITALNTKNTAEEASLKNEWGQNFAAEMAHASKGAMQFLQPVAKDKSADVIVAIENVLGYGATVRFLHSIGKGLGEASARGLDTTATKGTTTGSLADRLYPAAQK